MSFLALPLAIAGTALQVGAAFQQGKIAEANAKAEAANLEANAQARRAQAAEKARYYGEKYLQVKREGEKAFSKALSGYGAAHVQPNAQVLAEIQSDYTNQAYEYQKAESMAYSAGMWEADRMNQQADYARKIGKYQNTGYQLSGIGAGLMGGYNIYANLPTGRGTTLTGGTTWNRAKTAMNDPYWTGF